MHNVRAIGVLTSGGDAQGMNAALRAVIRTALDRGVIVYAISEGYSGMVRGGDLIRKMTWADAGGIMQRGGTVIGTARSAEFRTREGRLAAAKNLIEIGIDRLVVIGGDGSLTGANLFRQEWAGLLDELVASGRIGAEFAAAHPHLSIVGLVGSIDNDFWGTDMTIGTDTALHRITEAIDAISSTAASHQRTFVVEVMGRHCGYLALMGALSGGADWVLFPERPPDAEDWEEQMCAVMRAGRLAGRRDSIVVVAEGARDRAGNPISAERVRKVLEERLGEDARVTILGHVQRGGAPSAFDRWMPTLVGHAAVEELLSATADTEACVIGMRYNRVTRIPMMEAVRKTQEVGEAIAARDYDRAMTLRGGSFRDSQRIAYTLTQVLPSAAKPAKKQLRLAIVNAGGPAPGMNTAVRAATRLALDRGHAVFGVSDGFEGLANGSIKEYSWMSVNGWATLGGSQLGTGRNVPEGSDLYAIARNLEKHEINAVMMIGGLAGYRAMHKLYSERHTFPAFNIPMVCLPASINNNLPGSELSIGADTALNSIVAVIDKIKNAAGAQRCFIVEVMGRACGYLALMSGLATGAERVYLPEEGVSLSALEIDLNNLVSGFRQGKRMSLMIRGEQTGNYYTTDVMAALFEEEGKNLFDVRTTTLGHMQQGGSPSPFDRIQATRMASVCIDYLHQQCERDLKESSFIGLRVGKIEIFDMHNFLRMMDAQLVRPVEQWWMDLRPIARLLAQPGPTQLTP